MRKEEGRRRKEEGGGRRKEEGGCNKILQPPTYVGEKTNFDRTIPAM